MDIKNFLLKQKWVGALFLILSCLIIAFRAGGQVSGVMEEAIPVVEKEASAFLPLTFEEGVIVKPENALIERSYENNGETFKLVLDTRTDYFEPQMLTEKGIYVSREALYMYGRDIRIQNFKDVPNMVIDNEILSAGLNWLKGGLKPVLYGSLFFFVLLVGLIFIGINTLIFHWVLKVMYGVKLSQTIRVNTYAYIICAFLSLGFLLTLAVSFGLNFAVAALNKDEQRTQA